MNALFVSGVPFSSRDLLQLVWPGMVVLGKISDDMQLEFDPDGVGVIGGFDSDIKPRLENITCMP